MFDAIVIGAGPCGAALAQLLASGGARTLVLEATRGPTHKLCGEFLSPESQDTLRRLGVLPALHAAGAVPIRRVHIASGGAVFQGRLPGEALGLSRYALDARLAAAAVTAGAVLEDGAEAHGVTGRAGALRVHYRCGGDQQAEARVVIAAHGKRGRLDHALDRPFIAARHPYVAFKTHYDEPVPTDAIELHGFPGGYLGLSSVEQGRLNACLLATQGALREAGGYDGLLLHLTSQNSALAGRLARDRALLPRPLAIAQVAFSPKELCRRDVLMAGDAAALIAPLCGDGMAMALRGAELLAPLVLRYLGGDCDFPSLQATYRRAFSREFQQRLWLGRVLQAGLLRPHVARLGLRALHRWPSLGDVLIRATRGA